MMDKYTPGPWVYAIPGDSFIASSVGIMICRRPSETASPHGKKNWDANARLIAAAPELLEALDVMIAAYQGDLPVIDRKIALHNARAAIALARGES